MSAIDTLVSRLSSSPTFSSLLLSLHNAQHHNKPPTLPPFEEIVYSTTNPFALDHWRKDFGLSEYPTGSCILENKKWKGIVNAGVDYLTLRQRQQASWALEKVEEGVQLAHQKDFQKAIKEFYTPALKLDPTCIDAFVARGAAYANLHFWDAAIKDFKSALQLDENNENAKKYLKIAEEKKSAEMKEEESARRGEYLMEMDAPGLKQTFSRASAAPLRYRSSFVDEKMDLSVFSKNNEMNEHVESEDDKEKRKRKKEKRRKDKKEKKKRKKDRKRKKRKSDSDSDDSDSDSSRS